MHITVSDSESDNKYLEKKIYTTRWIRQENIIIFYKAMNNILEEDSSFSGMEKQLECLKMEKAHIICRMIMEARCVW